MAESFYPITPVKILTYDKTQSVSWDDVDVSAYVPAGATGVILHIVHDGSFYRDVGFRKNGSTDSRASNYIGGAHSWLMVGVDSDRIFEFYIDTSSYASTFDVWITGYTTSGVTMFTNAYDKSLTVTDAWTDIDLSTECPNAIGIIVEIVNTATNGVPVHYYGLRKNGSTDDRGVGGSYWTNVYFRSWAIIGCDENQIIEGKIDSTLVDFYIIGYITTGAVFFTNAHDKSLVAAGLYLNIDCSAEAPGANMLFFEVHHADGAAGNRSYALRKDDTRPNIYEQGGFCYPRAIVECQSDQIVEGKVGGTDCDFYLIGYAGSHVVYELYPNPADVTIRVSSIRHIFRPGVFRMQVGLGDLGFDIEVAEAAVRKIAEEALTQPFCVEGTTKVVEGIGTLVCIGGKWVGPILEGGWLG